MTRGHYRISPQWLVNRLQEFGFPLPCYSCYGVPDFPPAGLPPAEHVILFWSHFACARLSDAYLHKIVLML
jgi:hypothetical protein